MTEKIEILIGKSQYSLSCKTQEKEKLAYLSRKLSARIARLSLKLKDADDKTLLIMAALIAEDELEKKLESSFLEDEEGEKISDSDLCDAIAENMENIAIHLEKLTEKIKDF